MADTTPAVVGEEAVVAAEADMLTRLMAATNSHSKATCRQGIGCQSEDLVWFRGKEFRQEMSYYPCYASPGRAPPSHAQPNSTVLHHSQTSSRQFGGIMPSDKALAIM